MWSQLDSAQKRFCRKTGFTFAAAQSYWKKDKLQQLLIPRQRTRPSLTNCSNFRHTCIVFSRLARGLCSTSESKQSVFRFLREASNEVWTCSSRGSLGLQGTLLGSCPLKGVNLVCRKSWSLGSLERATPSPTPCSLQCLGWQAVSIALKPFLSANSTSSAVRSFFQAVPQKMGGTVFILSYYYEDSV